MSPWLRLLVLTATWLLALRHGGWLLARVLPNAWLSHLSLPSFSMIAQVAATALGLGLAFALFREARSILGFKRPSKLALATSVLVTPALFLAISVLALVVALPWLVEEQLQGRTHASRENAGAMGQALQEAPLLSTLLWAALFAALAEELFFRGAFFALVRDAAVRLRLGAGFAGAVAVLASAALFGFLHADTPGGVGIVRIVSTTCLGLVCGVARQLGPSVVAPIAMHTTYNVLALALARRWLDDGTKPLILALPNGLITLSGIALFIALWLWAWRIVMPKRQRIE